MLFMGQVIHMHALIRTRRCVCMYACVLSADELTMMVKNMQITAMPTMDAQ